MKTLEYTVNRRAFTAAGAGFAAGLFIAQAGLAGAQNATPAAMTPAGFVSARLRILTSADARPDVNALVLSQLAPKIQKLAGYGGYLLGDVIDQPTQSLSVVAFDRQSQSGGFDVLAKAFVASVGSKVNDSATKQWAGDLLMWGASKPESAAGGATPRTGNGYIAFRVHTSKPGTNPRDFVPAAIEGFLPIVTSLAGFKGYLWFPTDTGFVAVSVFDSIDSAKASNTAAKSWATQNLSKYTDGNPMIVNANVVFADLPIVNRLKPLVASR